MSKFILLDTETTGLNHLDRIIQLGFIVSDNKNLTVHETLCNQEIEIKFREMEVHGITKEMISGKPKLTDTNTFKTLMDLNKSENTLVIHNSSFDLSMLKKEGFINRMKLIDTLDFVRKVIPKSENHRLSYLRYSLGLYKMESEILPNRVKKSHDAISDVITMYCLLKHLVNLNGSLDGAYSDGSKHYVLLEEITFGKYKGCKYSDMIKSKRDYFDWCLDNMSSLTEDQRYTIKYHNEATIMVKCGQEFSHEECHKIVVERMEKKK